MGLKRRAKAGMNVAMKLSGFHGGKKTKEGSIPLSEYLGNGR